VSNNDDDKLRLLLADDSKLMRVSANKVLAGEFDIVFANDGEQAWQQLIDDHTIQAVFSDLTMPNLDGFGLLERVRTAEDKRINALPVIVITAGDDEAVREKAFQQGATDFVTKPFDSVDLRARARSHVNAQVQKSRLEAGSAVDPQTGLYNRRYFLERVDKDRSAAGRHGLALSLLYLELTDFRNLFMKNGKDVANEVLGQVAEIIRHEIRSEDTAAHVSLAQFALSLPFTDPDGAQRIGERLCQRIGEAPFRLRTEAIPVTARFGLLQVAQGRDSQPEELLTEVARQAS
jgi:diguanylate cyclase (GGDEF)-like protein